MEESSTAAKSIKFKSQSCPFLTVWSWESCLNSLRSVFSSEKWGNKRIRLPLLLQELNGWLVYKGRGKGVTQRKCHRNIHEVNHMCQVLMTLNDCAAGWWSATALGPQGLTR